MLFSYYLFSSKTNENFSNSGKDISIFGSLRCSMGICINATFNTSDNKKPRVRDWWSFSSLCRIAYIFLGIKHAILIVPFTLNLCIFLQPTKIWKFIKSAFAALCLWSCFCVNSVCQCMRTKQGGDAHNHGHFSIVEAASFILFRFNDVGSFTGPHVI